MFQKYSNGQGRIPLAILIRLSFQLSFQLSKKIWLKSLFGFALDTYLLLPHIVWAALVGDGGSQFNIAATGGAHAVRKALTLLTCRQALLAQVIRSTLGTGKIREYTSYGLINLLLTCHLTDQASFTFSVIYVHPALLPFLLKVSFFSFLQSHNFP